MLNGNQVDIVPDMWQFFTVRVKNQNRAVLFLPAHFPAVALLPVLNTDWMIRRG